MSIKWYSESIENVQEILKTNAALGLSCKAARSRLRKTGGNGFFFIKSKSVGSCLASVISDPMLLLLIGLDVVAALFGEIKFAISVGILILINLAVLCFSYIKSQRIIESMSKYSQPKIRVIRDGLLFLVDSRCIVPGDVILFASGDILPCDARLVSSNNLKIKIYNGKSSENTYTVLKPDASKCYEAGLNLDFFEYKNMLYAGSVILEGEGRAIVVETAENTYIGALEGGIALNETESVPKLVFQMRKFSKWYSFVVLLMILPLTVIGVFSYGSDKLLNTFMLTLSVAVSSLGDIIYVIGSIITASTLIRCAVGEGKSKGAMIKSVARIDKLAMADRLLIFGDAALNDGKFKVVSFYLGENEYRGKEISAKNAIRAAEYTLMIMDSATAFPSLSSDSAGFLPKEFKAFCNHIKIDFEAIKIRTTPMSFSSTNTKMIATVNDGGRVITVSAATEASALDCCTQEYVNGNCVILSAERRNHINQEFFKLVAEGCFVCIITTRVGGGGETFEGMFAFKKVIPSNVAEKMSELKTAGVEPIIFLEKEGAVETAIASESKVVSKRSEIAYASRINNGLLDTDKARAYLGFSVKEARKICEDIEKRNSSTVLFASEMKNYPYADILISCDRASYRAGKDNLEKLEDSTPAGKETSSDGAQVLRFSADVLVNRAGKKGGGIEGIYNAIAASRAIRDNILRVVKYLICSQALRFMLIIPAMIFGVDLLTPFQLLFSGMIVDLGAIITIAFDRSYDKVMREKANDFSLHFPLTVAKKELVASAIAGVATSITAIIIALVWNTTVSGAVFVSLTMTQLFALRLIRFNKRKPEKESNISVFITCVIVVSILIFAFVPKLAAITGTLFSPTAWICLPIGPVLYAVICFLPIFKHGSLSIKK